MEYDWFYLGGPATYMLHISQPGYGDMHDSLNTFNNTVVSTSGNCVNTRGLQWQMSNGDMHCACWYVFGQYGTTGFSFENYSYGNYDIFTELVAFRMMVKN